VDENAFKRYDISIKIKDLGMDEIDLK